MVCLIVLASLTDYATGDFEPYQSHTIQMVDFIFLVLLKQSFLTIKKNSKNLYFRGVRICYNGLGIIGLIMATNWNYSIPHTKILETLLFYQTQ
jgi:hypothetical protein